MNSTPRTLRPILLAEDNANDVELILTAFQEAGLANEIVVTRDGQEAIDYLYCRDAYRGRPATAPALVMIDLKMPRMDGREVLRVMREDPALRTVPAVILTSSKEEADLMQTYQLGANAYVVKPVAFDEFIRAVGQLGTFWTLLNELPPHSLPR